MAKHVGTQEQVVGSVTLTQGMYRGNEMNGQYDLIAGYKAAKTPKMVGEQEYAGFVRVLEPEGEDGARKVTRVLVPAENVGYTVVMNEPAAAEDGGDEDGGESTTETAGESETEAE